MSKKNFVSLILGTVGGTVNTRVGEHKRMCGVFGYGGFEVPKYNTFIEDKNGEVRLRNS